MKKSEVLDMKHLFLLCLLAWCTGCVSLKEKKQNALKDGIWRAALHRADGHEIVFNFEVRDTASRQVIYIMNAGERMLVDSLRFRGDSVYIHMPFFDSDFRALHRRDGSLEGAWVRHLADTDAIVPFTAVPDQPARFVVSKEAAYNVSGRWATTFLDAAAKDTVQAVGEFAQQGNEVTGTFLTTTGDYRYLQGVVDDDTLRLSCFDGSNAFLLTAHITDAQHLDGGNFYAGVAGHETWTARKDSTAQLPDAFSLTTIRAGEDRLHFSFPDLQGRQVSLSDSRYQGKVVLIQIMGSWCPNCMDETRFLSDYYRKNSDRGMEIVGLCYERTPDFNRSVKSVQSFQKRFDVQYELLITGVTPGDPQLMEKTLPEIQHFISFPTLIFLDRQGKVRKIHAGFSGPGTGAHYQEFITEFNGIMDRLLAEKAGSRQPR